MEKKFKLGSSWKTREGHRAVIVKEHNKGFFCWHDKPDVKYDSYHDENGLHTETYYYKNPSNSFDLIEPWVEKEKGEVTFYIFKVDDRIIKTFHSDGGMGWGDDMLLAKKKIAWTEGDIC